MSEMVVGVIGLGEMGGGIAGTLLKAGFKIAVYDLDPDRMAALAGAGAHEKSDVASICVSCDTVVLSLPSSSVTIDVVEQQIAPAARKGTTVVDMGTTVVAETRRLHAVLSARGVDLIDAPVSGGTAGAAAGALSIFVGGAKAAFDNQWELFQALGKGTYCGESGCGQIVKAVNQLAMGLVDAAYLEAVSFGVNAGVAPEILQEAVGGDTGFRARFREISAAVTRGDGDRNDVKYAELAYFLDEAGRTGFPTPLLSALYEYMSQFPESGRDNMRRPYPPLWSALIGRSVPKGGIQ